MADEKIGSVFVDLDANLEPLKVGITAGLALLNGYLVKASTEMDTAMRNVWTVLDVSEAGLEEYRRQIFNLSREIPQTGKQLAEGLYEIIQANVKAEDSMYLLEVAAKAASAGMTDTRVAVDGLTNIINAYGYSARDAGRLADIMFMSTFKGKMTLEEVATSMGKVVATAAAVGVPFEEVIAGMATMTQAGINAHESATALNALMNVFLNPTDDSKAVAELINLDLTLDRLAENGLPKMMEELNLRIEAMGTSSGEAISILGRIVPNIRALKGALSLGRNEGKDFAQMMVDVAGAEGSLSDAYDKQIESTANSIQLMKNALNEFAVKAGDTIVPVVRELAEGFTKVLDFMSSLPPGAIEVGLAAITLVGGFDTIRKGLTALTGAISGPLGWTIAIVAAYEAIAILVDRLENWDKYALMASEKTDKLLASMLKTTKEYGENASKLETLIPKYEELASKTELTEKEQAALNDTIAQIARIAPGAVAAYDDMGRAASINADAAKERMKQLYEAQLLVAQSANRIADMQIAKNKEYATTQLKSLDIATKQLAAVQASRTLQNKINADTKAWGTRMGWVETALASGKITTLEQAINMLGDKYGTVTRDMNTMLAGVLADPTTSAQFATLNVLQQIKALEGLAADKYKDKSEEALIDQILKLEESVKAFREYEQAAAAARVEIEGLTKAIETLNKAGAVPALGSKAAPATSQSSAKSSGVVGAKSMGGVGASSIQTPTVIPPSKEALEAAKLMQQRQLQMTSEALEENLDEQMGAVASQLTDFMGDLWEYALDKFNSTSYEQMLEDVNKGTAERLSKTGMDLANALKQIGQRLKDSGSAFGTGAGSKLIDAGDKIGGAIGQFIDAIAPILAMFDVIGLVIMAIKAIYDLIKAIVDFFKGRKEAAEEEEKKAGIQISEITGPMRDSIVTALDPLKALHNLGGYKNELVLAINSVRDALTGATLGAEGVKAGITQSFTIGTINIAAPNEATFSSIMNDLAKQVRLAEAGVGG